MGKQLKKALLIFAKCPLPGMVKTRLIPPLSPEQAADFYHCMLCDVIAKVTLLPDLARYLFYEDEGAAREYFAGSGLDMTSLPQQGKDLGERMAEALRTVFAMGHSTAVVIGTDSPDLPISFIEAAFDRLERGKSAAVFGPTEDGGYYLAGMTRLYRELFRDIPWSSVAVLRKTLKRAKEAGITVSLLPIWHDVDTAADLDRPELSDEGNGAPLTREFLLNWRKGGD
ncbi:MAG TPA: TIGR04282 family arsenosugar biosynthesis glycosyltransferase [Geobacteraceae bacterium]|nr:TIGR04282 family arsenosugar biosynthesis glycosyltransferase [Geobacteraceae bacterium]